MSRTDTQNRYCQSSFCPASSHPALIVSQTPPCSTPSPSPPTRSGATRPPVRQSRVASDVGDAAALRVIHSVTLNMILRGPNPTGSSHEGCLQQRHGASHLHTRRDVQLTPHIYVNRYTTTYNLCPLGGPREQPITALTGPGCDDKSTSHDIPPVASRWCTIFAVGL